MNAPFPVRELWLPRCLAEWADYCTNPSSPANATVEGLQLRLKLKFILLARTGFTALLVWILFSVMHLSDTSSKQDFEIKHLRRVFSKKPRERTAPAALSLMAEARTLPSPAKVVTAAQFEWMLNELQQAKATIEERFEHMFREQQQAKATTREQILSMLREQQQAQATIGEQLKSIRHEQEQTKAATQERLEGLRHEQLQANAETREKIENILREQQHAKEQIQEQYESIHREHQQSQKATQEQSESLLRELQELKGVTQDHQQAQKATQEQSESLLREQQELRGVTHEHQQAQQATQEQLESLLREQQEFTGMTREQQRLMVATEAQIVDLLREQHLGKNATNRIEAQFDRLLTDQQLAKTGIEVQVEHVLSELQEAKSLTDRQHEGLLGELRNAEFRLETRLQGMIRSLQEVNETKADMLNLMSLNNTLNRQIQTTASADSLSALTAMIQNLVTTLGKAENMTMDIKRNKVDMSLLLAMNSSVLTAVGHKASRIEVKDIRENKADVSLVSSVNATLHRAVDEKASKMDVRDMKKKGASLIIAMNRSFYEAVEQKASRAEIDAIQRDKADSFMILKLNRSLHSAVDRKASKREVEELSAVFDESLQQRAVDEKTSKNEVEELRAGLGEQWASLRVFGASLQRLWGVSGRLWKDLAGSEATRDDKRWEADPEMDAWLKKSESEATRAVALEDAAALEGPKEPTEMDAAVHANVPGWGRSGSREPLAPGIRRRAVSEVDAEADVSMGAEGGEVEAVAEAHEPPFTAWSPEKADAEAEAEAEKELRALEEEAQAEAERTYPGAAPAIGGAEAGAKRARAEAEERERADEQPRPEGAKVKRRRDPSESEAERTQVPKEKARNRSSPRVAIADAEGEDLAAPGPKTLNPSRAGEMLTEDPYFRMPLPPPLSPYGPGRAPSYPVRPRIPSRMFRTSEAVQLFSRAPSPFPFSLTLMISLFTVGAVSLAVLVLHSLRPGVTRNPLGEEALLNAQASCQTYTPGVDAEE